MIEAGIGLQIGVGKTIDKGILKAGLSLSLEVMLEGVLGFYNPSNSADSHALFYSVTGTAKLVGKLYGSVDFVIIKASLSVVLYAQITLNITAYQPILISAMIGVEVQASVKILFFTVHFSFQAQVDASFTIGSASTPPWTVVPDSKQGRCAAPAPTENTLSPSLDHGDTGSRFAARPIGQRNLRLGAKERFQRNDSRRPPHAGAKFHSGRRLSGQDCRRPRSYRVSANRSGDDALRG